MSKTLTSTQQLLSDFSIGKVVTKDSIESISTEDTETDKFGNHENGYEIICVQDSCTGKSVTFLLVDWKKDRYLVVYNELLAHPFNKV